jgi:hypothetical protein
MDGLGNNGSLSSTKLSIAKVSLSTNFLGVITNRNRLYINSRRQQEISGNEE